MMRWPTRLVVVAALVAALGAPASPGAAERVIPGFVVFCFFSHSLRDDPITNPGVSGGASHRHDFAGNVSTDAFSTEASMRAADTNCQDRDDTAGYWAPTLYSHGRAVHPDRLHSYYRWGNLRDVASIQPPPAGLRVIAGDAGATAPQPTSVIGWNCGVQGQRQYDHPISCSAGQKIVLHVFFPNCWDGVNLDSPDHRSHMAYSERGVCPASHPVAVPRLSQDYGYPLLDATGITLSSGSYLTAHADFWNTWDQAALTQLVEACVNRGRQCGPVTGPVS
jgi:Domain of unknown function (DUF1996)